MTYRLYSTPIPPCSRSERRGLERIAVATLVRQAFGPEAVLTHDSNGAPHVAGLRDLFFSLTHCVDSCMMVVTGDGPVGIDTEVWRPQLLRVAPRFVSPGEAPGLTPPRLLKLWTAKEAVYKAALTPGLGLTEIVTSPDCRMARVRDMKFHIDYPFLAAGRVTAVAVRTYIL